MIGPKKLGTIREQLRGDLAATGEDPIEWLEKRMTTPERHGVDASGESEVLRSLRRVLEPTEKEKRGRRRAGMKK